MPKKLLFFVIDQMRFDYFEALQSLKPNLNMLKLKKKSAFFSNAFVKHLPTSTPPGHAAISTGSLPSENGIVGSDWFNKKENKIIKVVEYGDARHMLSQTLASTAKENGFKIVVIAGKADSAILLGGDKADLTFFPCPFQLEKGKKVLKFVDRKDVFEKLKQLEKTEDEPRLDKQDLQFTPNWAKNKDLWITDEQKLTPTLDKVTSRVVHLALENELHDIENWVLFVSFSGTDNIGHMYGPGSQEVYKNLLSLDACMKEILKRSEVVHSLFILGADHGCTNLQYSSKMIPLQEGENLKFKFVVFDRERNRLDDMGKEIGAEIAKHICFNNSKNFGLVAEGIGFVYVKNSSRRYIKRIAKYFENKFPELIEKVYQRGDSNAPEEIKATYNERTGDLILIPREGHRFIKDGWDPPKGEHGSLGEDEQHIPFLISGPNIKAGVYNNSVQLHEIASTIKVLLDLPLTSDEKEIGERITRLITAN